MPSRRSKTPPAVQPRPVPAVRLIFEVDGDRITLLSQQPVDMVVTGAELAQRATTGTFVDARDASDRTLARVHAHGVGEETMEVFPEKPGDPIERVPVGKRKTAFTVVVPAPQAAARVAVVRLAPAVAASPRAAGAAASSAAAPTALDATELASFDLQRRP